MSDPAEGPNLHIGTRIRRLVAMALEEDAVENDPSTAAFPEEHRSSAQIVARESLVLAGHDLARCVFREVDDQLTYEAQTPDGTRVESGTPVASIEGRTANLLRAERTALNFLQRLTGIATRTAAYAEVLSDSPTDIVDTRKTLPGFRTLDKYAVRCGGGANHRYNLSGGVIVKDNHIAAAGGIRPAVEAIRERTPHLVRIEVEVETIDELERALEVGADAVMLDNMSTEQMERGVELVRERVGDEVRIEASGTITLDRLPELADLGLDIVSAGALTHSVRAADLSMVFSESE